MFDLSFFLEKLAEYWATQKRLYAQLIPLITLKSVDDPNYHFSPTCTSIVAQINHWPKDEFRLPPAAWVSSRKGDIVLNNNLWTFAFHGNSISFFNQKTCQDVSLDYAENGEVGLTKYNFYTYLDIPSQNINIGSIDGEYDDIFEQAVQLGYLVKLSPWLPFSDDVYIIKSNKITVHDTKPTP